MDQSKLKSLTLIIGGAGSILAGLFYVLYSDLYLVNTSEWLFAGIISALGSAAAFLLSEGIKNKKAIFLALKGLAVLCILGFVFVMVSFSKNFDILALVKSQGITTDAATARVTVSTIVAIVLAVVGAIGQIANFVINCVVGIDD